MSEMNHIQQEIAFKEMVTEIKASISIQPRVYAVADFVDMKTIIVSYDKFVGIMEYDDDLNVMVYVAFGRNPSGDLSNPMIQLLDVRMITDKEMWLQANKAFVELIMGKEPMYTRELSGVWEPHVIITHIIDTWALADEMNKAVIH